MQYINFLLRDRLTKIILILISVMLCWRLMPYLAPIYYNDIKQTEVAAEYRDRNSLLLGVILSRDENHTAVVPLSQVSPWFIKAILAAEDGRFYHHGALSLKALARSLYQAARAGKIQNGASTITMQLARMLEPNPRTLPAKIKEIWLSWRLVAGMSKDEILQAYINRLPFGGNIYGVEAASRIYFNTPASQLTVAQASILAAIPNNPNYLNPYDYWLPLKKRQRYVLNRMVADGYLTDSEAEKAYQEEVTIFPRNQGIIAAPHFLFWLSNQDNPNHTSTIQTTIDLPLQQFVETQVKEVVKSLKDYNVNQGAAIVIDNHTGEILAYVGSLDYFAESQLGKNDAVQALRQPGSTLKPFLYQLALEKGIIKANSILADVPTHYPIPGARIYSPKDYSETYYGPVRIRVALANSLNIPAVRLLEKVGVANFLNYLHQLGFSHLNQSPEYYGLGLALGSGEVTLFELAKAYFIASQQGEIKPIVSVIGEDSTTKKAIPHQTTWALITDILSDRYARAHAFGVDSILNLPFPAAVKTGTSSNFRDTWTVGYTTDYTVATWVGNFDGQPMEKISGIMGAAPLWQRIMLHLHQDRQHNSFDTPVGMVKRPVCALSGLKPTSACPSVVLEYFDKQDLQEYETKLDNFYLQVGEGYRLNLPPEYNQWLAKQSQPNLEASKLKIISPKNGDKFIINSQENNRLQFRIAGRENQVIEWRLNGELLALTASNSIFWQAKPGKWHLEVKGKDTSDTIDFEIHKQASKLIRRGFSLK